MYKKMLNLFIVLTTSSIAGANVYLWEDFEGFTPGQSLDATGVWVQQGSAALGIASDVLSYPRGGISGYFEQQAGIRHIISEGELPSEFVISAWFYHDASGPAPHYMLVFRGPAGSDWLGVGTVETIENYSIRDKRGTGQETDTGFPRKNWVNIVWQVTQNGTEVFLDGQSVYTSIITGDTWRTAGSFIWFANVWADAGYAYLDSIGIADTLEELEISNELASNPSPADGAADVAYDGATLTWSPGINAQTHNVYFGTVFNDVNNATVGVPLNVLANAGQDANFYDPGRLNFGTTYYWRVDEVNAPPDLTVFKGNVWSFTTEPVGYPIDGANITATASSSGGADFGPEKTIDGSGLDENDQHSTNAIHMWISDSEPSGAWIQYEFDKVYKLHQMWIWNSNQIFEGLFGFGLKDVTVDYSIDGTDWMALAGVPEFAQATGSADYAHDTTVDFGGAVAKYVKLTATSNWGGTLPQYGLSEVRFFSIPVSAREPSPEAGTIDVHPDVTLSWRAGREASTHDMYLSTDQQAVNDGTAPAVTVNDPSYSTTLNLGTTYYWRVDEVNEAETPATWQGDVWDFTTQQFIVVDGFEDYNDYPPYEIYSTWLDGYENPANGSQVGYLTPPAVEKTIVHDGKQSMPLIYSNTGGATYSEAARTFGVPQDWTKYGISTLQLWFYGTAGNTGQLYVKINGVKVPYSGETANLAVESWQPWDIDLTTVGVNLATVTSLTIGIDGNAAAGTLYFDDIRLH